MLHRTELCDRLFNKTRPTQSSPGRFHYFRSTIIRIYLIACCLSFVAINSLGTEVTTNQHVGITNKHETVKLGNQKTNNYNFMEHKFSPVHLNQVVVNVGKPKNKLRKSRSPTESEYQIKERIMQVYGAALREIDEGEESLVHMAHLGQILTALNPKYIATERVAQAAFADPTNLESIPHVVAPESQTLSDSETLAQQDFDVEKLMGAIGEQHAHQDPGSSMCQGGSPEEMLLLSVEQRHDGLTIGQQLDELDQRFQKIAQWDESFAQGLYTLDDDELTETQIAFKQLLQCLSYPMACGKMSKPAKKLDGLKKLKKTSEAISPGQSLMDLIDSQTGDSGPREKPARAKNDADRPTKLKAKTYNLETQPVYRDNPEVVQREPVVKRAPPPTRTVRASNVNQQQPQGRLPPEPQPRVAQPPPPARPNYQRHPKAPVYEEQQYYDDYDGENQWQPGTEQEQNLEPYEAYDEPDYYGADGYEGYYDDQLPPEDNHAYYDPPTVDRESDQQEYKMQTRNRATFPERDSGYGRYLPDDNLVDKLVDRHAPSYRQDRDTIRNTARQVQGRNRQR